MPIYFLLLFVLVMSAAPQGALGDAASVPGILCGTLETLPAYFPTDKNVSEAPTERFKVAEATWTTGVGSAMASKSFPHLLLIAPLAAPTFVLANGRALKDPMAAPPTVAEGKLTTLPAKPTGNASWLLNAMVPRLVGQPLCVPGHYIKPAKGEDYFLMTVPYLGFVCGQRGKPALSERMSSGVIAQYSYSMQSPVFCTEDQSECGPPGGDISVVVPATFISLNQATQLLTDHTAEPQKNCWKGALFPKAHFVLIP